MIPPMLHDWILLATVTATGLPFLAFALIMFFTRARPGPSAALSLGAAAVALINALFLLLAAGGQDLPIQYAGRWLVVGNISVSFGFLLDPTSLLMMALVAGTSFLVQVYSLGYLAGDPGFGRYFAFQALFAGAMIVLVLSADLLQLYVFWELVGLCSYLLIGFWYEKFSATQAGKKAFVLTRLGDVCFFLGLLLLLLHLGRLNILEMNRPGAAAGLPPGLLTLAALLILGGVAGKSAQFPLMTWLPEAMEGPTPVSALLHSATMVAAGVYLLVRLFPFLSQAPAALTFFLAVGTLSLLLASALALVERDIKKLWAYSTISQLGYMIMAVGAGGTFAGFFHLTTHAGFKALLFLCAGVWIHYLETNDLYELSRRQARKLKLPLVGFLLAGASLSGIPPLSGFFSKEAVLGALAELDNPCWLLAGMAGVFLTAYYAFRPVFIILFPRETEPGGPRKDPAGDPAYRVMAGPLAALIAWILILGFLETPLRDFLAGQSRAEGPGPWIPGVSQVLVFSALILAWVEFGRKGSRQIGFAERLAPLRKLLAEGWYLDRFYRVLLEQVLYRIFADLLTRNERQLLDRGLERLGHFTRNGGGRLARLQSGRLRYNLLGTFAVLVLAALYFFI